MTIDFLTKTARRQFLPYRDVWASLSSFGDLAKAEEAPRLTLYSGERGMNSQAVRN
ncbi:hypothetical protein [Nostoc commune]|uniref:hypothetical protein n=1 Tax=Nostoc commune TaxID=1178 RepID=UPI0015E8255F|nr:hypothetical protein [Nostoc commune]